MSTINHAPVGILQWPIEDPNFTTVDPSSLQILERFQLCFLGAHSNLVGREFLPRGSGNVTRRPLILQLIHCPAANRNQILHDTEAETRHLDDREIAPNPIHLRIFSPKVLTLTLIDLPGIAVKHPIYEQPIRNMLIQYISSPACLIIAVISAQDDLAHCKALKMAREVDPGRAPDFWVLTKVDLMDPGYDVEEREFFKRHPSYQAKAEYCGMPFFAHKLNLWLKLLVQV
ncbi:P-loop containing nucleoside triphosphate hydrolase protein [Favolaschia claudopus]|uniref:P-loop containing nucleoside triphosphate hydrolase protein n=1 Tax=Favolaschia claudopus TaxID=2862362 RepID=A0AAW0AC77_9AGAR